MRTDDILYSVIDTETTGLDFDARIIEIAIVQLAKDTLEERYRFHTLVYCHRHIPEVITAINGISREMLRDTKAPVWRDIWPFVVHHLHGTILVGHNIHFDIRMLVQTCLQERAGYISFNPGRPIDTQELVEGQRLTAAVEEYNLTADTLLPAHAALHDALMTAELFRLMVPRHDEKITDKRIRIPRPCTLATRFVTRD